VSETSPIAAAAPRARPEWFEIAVTWDPSPFLDAYWLKGEHQSLQAALDHVAEQLIVSSHERLEWRFSPDAQYEVAVLTTRPIRFSDQHVYRCRGIHSSRPPTGVKIARYPCRPSDDPSIPF
jgi:hypothetical protein